MAVLVGNHTKLIVQGITGREGLFHAIGCRDYGTNVEEGKAILAASGLNLIVAADLKDAATKVVASIQ